jgi:hypothetical protein
VSEIEQELRATLGARQEVGPALEPQLVQRFVDQIESEIDRRIDAKLFHERRRRKHGGAPIGLPLGSMALAIPLIAIAGGLAGVVGVIAVSVAIVLVNYLWLTRG